MGKEVKGRNGSKEGIWRIDEWKSRIRNEKGYEVNKGWYWRLEDKD